jgi:hypothetical protein
MISPPDETLLLVVDHRADKARRRRAALAVGLAWVTCLVLMQRGSLLGLSWPIWTLPILLVGLVIAGRAGLFERARALLQLGSIRRDGLRATEMLVAGDVEGAKQAYAALLPRARSLGAFHATHVLMSGVTRFLEGDAHEGLKLVSRALDSGWFESPRMKPMGEVAETWRILILLELGQRSEARARLTSAPGLATAALAVDAGDERWSDVVDRALRTLDGAKFPPAGRPTIALLGRHAARQIQHEALDRFEAVLAAEPLSELARKNPAYQRFL